MAAGLGFKDFVTGEVLTAADVDGYLMQGIWVFADATARDAAVTSPQEGNACYLKDTNEVLTYSGSVWVAVGGGSPLTTKGDLFTFSTTDARLPVGTDGFTLVADSGESVGMRWATPSGSLTLISTTAMTSGSAITLSSIPTTYNSLYFTITSWRASAGASIRLTFNGAASANDYANVPADQSALNFAGSFLQLTGSQDSAATNSFVRGNLPNYSDTTSWKILESTAITNNDGTPTEVRGYYGKIGATDQTAAITSLVFTLNTGTFAAGTLNLYGVK